MPGKPKFRGMRSAGLGIEFAAAVAGLTLLGYWIDRRYATEPWGLLIGAALGLIGGTYNMVREALTTARSSREPASKDPDSAEGSEKEADEGR